MIRTETDKGAWHKALGNGVMLLTLLAFVACRGEEGKLLDFGCATGSSIPHFRTELPRASILAADVSSRSLDEAVAS